jgi:hypothetical protein
MLMLMDMIAGSGREGLFAWALPMAAIGDRQQQTAADDARPGVRAAITGIHHLHTCTATALFQRPQT